MKLFVATLVDLKLCSIASNADNVLFFIQFVFSQIGHGLFSGCTLTLSQPFSKLLDDYDKNNINIFCKDIKLNKILDLNLYFRYFFSHVDMSTS